MRRVCPLSGLCGLWEWWERVSADMSDHLTLLLTGYP